MPAANASLPSIVADIWMQGTKSTSAVATNATSRLPPSRRTR